MKTQKEMWRDINKPKILEFHPIFDKNGKLITISWLVDRVPKITRNRKRIRK